MSDIVRGKQATDDGWVRTQTITLDMNDLLNAAIQEALNDGNGLDGIGPGTKMRLRVMTYGGDAAIFDAPKSFDFYSEANGGLTPIAEYPTSVEVRLSIQNPVARGDTRA